MGKKKGGSKKQNQQSKKQDDRELVNVGLKSLFLDDGHGALLESVLHHASVRDITSVSL